MRWATTIAAVGCASISPIDAPSVRASCPAWSVPLARGEVVTCSAERIVVRFDGEAMEPVALSWRDALVADGWMVVVDATAPGSPVLSLARGDERVVLGVVASGGLSVATAARVP